MKALFLVVALMFGLSTFAAEPAKKETAEVKTDNCVKKDKNGKCPPAPKGEKPKPKKKSEEKK